MISALRKIEGRGELPGATSAVMEMCIDNPREGFGELFDTHPSVDNRVAALVKFAGGHDPGPLALPPQASDQTEISGADRTQPGPWDANQSAPNQNVPNEDKPAQPWGAPAEADSAASESASNALPGPWGPHKRG
jgi:heat shock protein HtpX